MNFYILIYVLILLMLHECGHIIAAKAMELNIEKVGFSFLPVPRLYVSIIDNNIPLKKKLLYLLGGNFMTLLLFVSYLISPLKELNIYNAFAFQLIVETNPFYSDYAVAIISYIALKKIKNIYSKIKYKKDAIDTEDIIKDVKNEYLFSKIWYIHFIIWTLIIVFLFAILKFIKL